MSPSALENLCEKTCTRVLTGMYYESGRGMNFVVVIGYIKLFLHAPQSSVRAHAVPGTGQC